MEETRPFAARALRCAEALRSEGLAALALMPGPNLRYLTGVKGYLSERLALLLLAADSRAAFVVPAFEAGRMQQEAQIEAGLFAYADEDGPQPALEKACQALGLTGQRVGAESLQMRLFEFWALQEASGGATVSADVILANMRMTKDAHELATTREAIRRTEEVLRDFVREIRPGRTEKELTAILRFALTQAGEAVSFPPIVGVGPGGALPHASPSDRAVQTGDLVVVDCGMFYEGYVSDITRTFAVGTLDEDLRRMYDVVQEANRAGREAAGPGVPCQEVDRAARRVIEQAGYGEYFTHRTGHGIGLEIHEPPYIVEGNDFLLQPGMTFTVEPGIYLVGRAGVRVEDDVLITSDGAETLTSYPRELTVL
jgi:Xaa-Pro dipeptidase